jgi:transcriptional regulator with XRE-family HTH domain
MVERDLAGGVGDKESLKKEFSRRLYQAMRAKDWRQADLHRASGLPKDSISTYYRGLVLPTSYSLDKLAKALDVQPEWLVPGEAAPSVSSSLPLEGTPPYEMRVLPWDSKRAMVKINKPIRTKTAVQIIGLVEADDADGE